jgi:tetratricopeptide (TPR) repeat protein
MSFASQSVFLQAIQSRAAAVCLILGLLTTPVWANDYAEVNRLMRAGQWSEALSRADAYLMSRPQDPQMRFIKGVIFTETNRTNDAIATFQKLTEEFPELPEPYNNLAVLYAAQNQFDKARQALEMAIRTNPSYATAHENLGDVYAKLASQSYSKALQLDNTNTVVPPKLALIRNLLATDKSVKNTPTTPTKPATTPAPNGAANIPPKTSAVAAPSPLPVNTDIATPATDTTAKQSKEKLDKGANAAPTQPATDTSSPATGANAREKVSQAVHAWAKAWSNKNMTGYLGAYDSSFRPPNGRTRQAWEQDRRDRIVGRNAISVEISNLEVKIQGEKAIVTFRQNYKADSISANSRKTLELVQRNGRWLISRESVG